MCRDGWCANIVLDVVTETVAAMDDGRSARRVACHLLARALDATAAAYAVLDLASGRSSIECWSLEEPAAMIGLVSEEVAGVLRTPDAWLGSNGFAALRRRLDGANMAHIVLQRDADLWIVVAFARCATFSRRQLHLMHVARRPLAVLDAHVQRLDGTREPGAAHRDHDLSGTADHFRLTPRELEVLEMLGQGLMARSMAQRMRVSPRTVHKHLGSLYRKLDTHDRLVAVTRAQALGLLPTVVPSAS